MSGLQIATTTKGLGESRLSEQMRRRLKPNPAVDVVTVPGPREIAGILAEKTSHR